MVEEEAEDPHAVIAVPGRVEDVGVPDGIHVLRRDDDIIWKPHHQLKKAAVLRDEAVSQTSGPASTNEREPDRSEIEIEDVRDNILNRTRDKGSLEHSSAS